MEEFHKVRRLPPYVFEQVNRLKASARAAGADIIAADAAPCVRISRIHRASIGAAQDGDDLPVVSAFPARGLASLGEDPIG